MQVSFHDRKPACLPFTGLIQFSFSLRSRIPAHPKMEGRVWAEAHSPVWVPDGEAPVSYPGRDIRHRQGLFYPHGSGRRHLHWRSSHRTYSRSLSPCPDSRSRSPCHHRHCFGSRSHCPGFCSQYSSSLPSGFLFRSSIKVTVNINSSYAHLLYDTICKEEEKVPADKAASSSENCRLRPPRSGRRSQTSGRLSASFPEERS